MSQTVTCPLCGDYDGEVSSVKAHITGKGDEAHKGRQGQQYADLLERRAGGGEPDPDEDPEADPEADGDTDDGADDGEGDGTMVTANEYAAQHGADDGAGDGSDEDEDGQQDTSTDATGGVDVMGALEDVPTLYIVAAALLVCVVGYLLLAESSGSTEAVDVESTTEEDQTGGFAGVIE